MEKQFQKISGYSLIVSSLLLIFTMVLHPSGGSIEHLLKIYKIAIGAHSIAIFSMPFVGFGFYGLSMMLLTKSRVSMLAFIIIALGLVAGMLAASFNGLILPLFIVQHANDTEQNLNIIKLIINYGFYINKSMDYIFIISSSLSTGVWSLLMIYNNKISKWIGYYGLVLLLFAIAGLVLQFNFTNLFGFRIYVFGIVSWIILTGYSMIKQKVKSDSSITT